MPETKAHQSSLRAEVFGPPAFGGSGSIHIKDHKGKRMCIGAFGMDPRNSPSLSQKLATSALENQALGTEQTDDSTQNGPVPFGRGKIAQQTRRARHG